MNEAVHELTDYQWKLIEKTLDDQRQRWHSLRSIVNAILSINRTGGQWRELDSQYPPWQTVYYHFRQFKLRGIWEELLDKLVVKERVRQQRQTTPSLLAIDSQSVKIMQFIEEETGIDGAKNINGRKRSIAVDRLGLPWSLAVTSANTSDNEAGRLVVDRLRGKVPRLEVIAADQGYKISFMEYVEEHYGWKVEIAPQRRTVKARKRSWFCTRKESLARRTQFWVAQFQAPIVWGCGENGRKFGGYATNCFYFHYPESLRQINYQNKLSFLFKDIYGGIWAGARFDHSGIQLAWLIRTRDHRTGQLVRVSDDAGERTERNSPPIRAVAV